MCDGSAGIASVQAAIRQLRRHNRLQRYAVRHCRHSDPRRRSIRTARSDEIPETDENCEQGASASREKMLRPGRRAVLFEM